MMNKHVSQAISLLAEMVLLYFSFAALDWIRTDFNSKHWWMNLTLFNLLIFCAYYFSYRLSFIGMRVKRATRICYVAMLLLLASINLLTGNFGYAITQISMILCVYLIVRSVQIHE